MTIISGVKIVPRPNPEKKVKIAAKKVTKEIINISIILKFILKLNYNYSSTIFLI